MVAVPKNRGDLADCGAVCGGVPAGGALGREFVPGVQEVRRPAAREAQGARRHGLR